MVANCSKWFTSICSYRRDRGRKKVFTFVLLYLKACEWSHPHNWLEGEYRTAHLPHLHQRQLQSHTPPSSWSGPGQQHRLSWGQDGGHQSPLAGCSSQLNLLGLRAPRRGSFSHKGPQLPPQNMKRKRVSLCPQAALHWPRNHPGLRSAHFGSVYTVYGSPKQHIGVLKPDPSRHTSSCQSKLFSWGAVPLNKWDHSWV